MAPEMCNIGGYNYVTNQKSHKFFSTGVGYNGVQTDTFALGIILFALLMGRPPFQIADINDPFYRLIFTEQLDEFWAPWDQFARQNDHEISDDFKQLFISLVSFSPLMRLSINEVLSSSWMQLHTPTNLEVAQYMGKIKVQMQEFETHQMTEETGQSKVKQESIEENKNLDDS
jgi:serine/threonine protein kinase